MSDVIVDLEQCAREPIHIPGFIQPHGVLFVLREAGLQVLQEDSMEAVGTGVVGFMQQPAGVARQAVLHRKDHAGEFAGRDADALLSDQSAHRVECQETGLDLLGEFDAGLRLRDTWIVVVGLGPWYRAGRVHFPGQW